MNKTLIALLLAGLATPGFAATVKDLGLIVEPKNAQDKQTQQQDERECVADGQEDAKKNKSALIKKAAKRSIGTQVRVAKKLTGIEGKKKKKEAGHDAALRESVTTCLEDRGYSVQNESKE